MSTIDIARPAPSAAPASTSSAVGDGRGNGRLRRLLVQARRLSGLAVIVAFWQYAAPRGWLGSTTPAPTDVWAAAVELIRTGELQAHLLVSLERVAKGLAFGLTAGLLLGMLAGLVKAGEDVVDAPIQALRMLPHLALVPLFIIWFGIGETEKIALITIGPIFPLYINVLHGIRGVDERYVESARSCGLGTFGLIRRVILPGAVPQIFVGVRQALGIGWLSLVVAEQTATTRGIGFLMNDAREFLRTDIIFVVLVVYAALGLLTDQIVRLVERRTLAWRRGFTGV